MLVLTSFRVLELAERYYTFCHGTGSAKYAIHTTVVYVTSSIEMTFHAIRDIVCHFLVIQFSVDNTPDFRFDSE